MSEKTKIISLPTIILLLAVMGAGYVFWPRAGDSDHKDDNTLVTLEVEFSPSPPSRKVLVAALVNGSGHDVWGLEASPWHVQLQIPVGATVTLNATLQQEGSVSCRIRGQYRKTVTDLKPGPGVAHCVSVGT